MNLNFIIVAVGILGLSLLVHYRLQSQKRRKLLEQAGRTSTWDLVKQHPENVGKIIQIDFGYGKEFWAIADKADDVDLGLRAFKSGVLILPRPSDRDVKDFCQSKGLELSLKLVK